jgi:hypothetical protein
MSSKRCQAFSEWTPLIILSETIDGNQLSLIPFRSKLRSGFYHYSLKKSRYWEYDVQSTIWAQPQRAPVNSLLVVGQWWSISYPPIYSFILPVYVEMITGRTSTLTIGVPSDFNSFRSTRSEYTEIWQPQWVAEDCGFFESNCKVIRLSVSESWGCGFVEHNWEMAITAISEIFDAK